MVQKRSLLVAVLSAVLASCGSSSPVPAPSPVTPPPAPSVPAPPPPPAPVAPVRDPALFSQTFWNEFVHNTFDAPSGNVPLRRLSTAPMLYLKTVDEAGVTIDPVTLSSVEQAMRDVATIWGGGQFGLAGVQRGTETRAGQPGWLTVRWLAANVSAICGQSTVGVDGGVIDLNYQNAGTSCTCPGINIRPRTAKHELGHAFGYYHTDSQDDLMRNGALGCDANPSARERYHAQLAYQSAIGTTTALPATSWPTITD